jgi:pimeloyl-ACP methyl ester carboxylesterase
MIKLFRPVFIAFSLLLANTLFSQDSIVLKDIAWNKSAAAGSTELFIPSGKALLAGVIYRANGPGKHPTLLLLHGYPGNERSLDLAQFVRAHGWNVIYFDYRGSWGSQGKFSFKNSVEDVVNLVAFCKKYQDSLKIDTSNIALFGHSMGGWVCLKALQQLPGVKKGFALSAWNIGSDFTTVSTEKELDQMLAHSTEPGKYFVLNAPAKEQFTPVIINRKYYDLKNDANALAGKQIIMLDEHNGNKQLAEILENTNKAFFEYSVWETDHPFSNKRASLINKVIAFLDK